MKKVIYITVLIVFSAAYGAWAATATVSSGTCARLTEHKADSSVAYQPGVDAQGRKVAPAGTGGEFKFKAPKEIKIPIQIDPGLSSEFSTSDTTVGNVTYRDGRLYYNGKPLQDDETARIARLCQRR